MKKIPKYIPLGILIAAFAYAVFIASTTNIILINKHYIGGALLAACALLYFIRHRIAQILLLITLILGTFNVVAFTAGININRFGSGLVIQTFSFFVLIVFFVVNFSSLRTLLDKYRK